MPLSWTEIRDRSTQFQKRWSTTESEQAESLGLRHLGPLEERHSLFRKADVQQLPLARRGAIEAAAQGVLDAAVDAAYVPDGGKKAWASDAERVAFLFTRHQQLTSLLPVATPKKPAKRAPRTAKKPV